MSVNGAIAAICVTPHVKGNARCPILSTQMHHARHAETPGTSTQIGGRPS